MTNPKRKIAFVGNFKYNCGSSNALLGYIKAGSTFNCDVRVSDFGYIDKVIRSSIPVANRDWQPDLLIIVYESYPFLSQNDIEEICSFIPRSKRIIIDPDGKYLEPFDSYNNWTELYDLLADTILQPYIGKKKAKNIYPFLYFGIDSKIPDYANELKKFDLSYVGNNWYRWHDIEWLIKALIPIRSQLKRVALIGQFWSDEVMEKFKKATYSDPYFLAKNQIEIYKSIPYGQVELTMSRSKLNPIFIRQILNDLRFITPRMFETISADTVPLIPHYFKHASLLYGEDIGIFTLSLNHPTQDIIRILQDYKSNIKLVKKIRKMLKEKHSYEVRLKEILNFM